MYLELATAVRALVMRSHTPEVEEAQRTRVRFERRHEEVVCILLHAAQLCTPFALAPWAERLGPVASFVRARERLVFGLGASMKLRLRKAFVRKHQSLERLRGTVHVPQY